MKKEVFHRLMGLMMDIILSRRDRVRRFVALILSSVLLSTQILFAHTQEETIWKTRRAQQPPVQLALASPVNFNFLPGIAPSPVLSFDRQGKPLAAQSGDPVLNRLLASLSVDGVLQDVRIPSLKNSSYVVVVQDVHGETEAQKNICSLMKKILSTHPTAVVGLEGATGDVGVASLKSAYPGISDEAASFFFNTGLITGPERAVLSGAGTPRVVGLEERALYRSNEAAVKAALAEQKEWKERLHQWKQESRTAATTIFAGRAAMLDRNWRRYHDDSWGLGDYAPFLATLTTIDANRFPNLEKFLKARAIESTLDFKRTESERSDFLSALTRRLNKKQLGELAAVGLAYQSGEMTYTGLHRALLTFSKQGGIDLRTYSHFTRYIDYVELCDSIRADSLLTELARCEDVVWKEFLATPAQKEFHDQTVALNLLDRLVSLDMTTSDWHDYKGRETSVQQLLATKTFSPGSLDSFLKFYQAAEKRDRVLSRTFIDSFQQYVNEDEKKPHVGILVAGGFHTQGIEQNLLKQGVGVIVVSPKIVNPKSTEGQEYLSIFTREKTPLDEIFNSRKITLVESLRSGGVNPAATRSFTALFMAATIALAAVDHQLKPNDPQRAALSRDFQRGGDVVVEGPAVTVTLNPVDDGNQALVAQKQITVCVEKEIPTATVSGSTDKGHSMAIAVASRARSRWVALTFAALTVAFMGPTGGFLQGNNFLLLMGSLVLLAAMAFPKRDTSAHGYVLKFKEIEGDEDVSVLGFMPPVASTIRGIPPKTLSEIMDEGVFELFKRLSRVDSQGRTGTPERERSYERSQKQRTANALHIVRKMQHRLYGWYEWEWLSHDEEWIQTISWSYDTPIEELLDDGTLSEPLLRVGIKTLGDLLRPQRTQKNLILYLMSLKNGGKRKRLTEKQAKEIMGAAHMAKVEMEIKKTWDQARQSEEIPAKTAVPTVPSSKQTTTSQGKKTPRKLKFADLAMADVKEILGGSRNNEKPGQPDKIPYPEWSLHAGDLHKLHAKFEEYASMRDFNKRKTAEGQQKIAPFFDRVAARKKRFDDGERSLDVLPLGARMVVRVLMEDSNIDASYFPGSDLMREDLQNYTDNYFSISDPHKRKAAIIARLKNRGVTATFQFQDNGKWLYGIFFGSQNKSSSRTLEDSNALTASLNCLDQTIQTMLDEALLVKPRRLSHPLSIKVRQGPSLIGGVLPEELQKQIKTITIKTPVSQIGLDTPNLQRLKAAGMFGLNVGQLKLEVRQRPGIVAYEYDADDVRNAENFLIKFQRKILVRGGLAFLWMQPYKVRDDMPVAEFINDKSIASALASREKPITTVRELQDHTWQQLKATAGLGAVTVGEIIAALYLVGRPLKVEDAAQPVEVEAAAVSQTATEPEFKIPTDQEFVDVVLGHDIPTLEEFSQRVKMLIDLYDRKATYEKYIQVIKRTYDLTEYAADEPALVSDFIDPKLTLEKLFAAMVHKKSTALELLSHLQKLHKALELELQPYNEANLRGWFDFIPRRIEAIRKESPARPGGALNRSHAYRVGWALVLELPLFLLFGYNGGIHFSVLTAAVFTAVAFYISHRVVGKFIYRDGTEDPDVFVLAVLLGAAALPVFAWGPLHPVSLLAVAAHEILHFIINVRADRGLPPLTEPLVKYLNPAKPAMMPLATLGVLLLLIVGGFSAELLDDRWLIGATVFTPKLIDLIIKDEAGPDYMGTSPHLLVIYKFFGTVDEFREIRQYKADREGKSDADREKISGAVAKIFTGILVRRKKFLEKNDRSLKSLPFVPRIVVLLLTLEKDKPWQDDSVLAQDVDDARLQKFAGLYYSPQKGLDKEKIKQQLFERLPKRESKKGEKKNISAEEKAKIEKTKIIYSSLYTGGAAFDTSLHWLEETLAHLNAHAATPTPAGIKQEMQRDISGLDETFTRIFMGQDLAEKAALVEVLNELLNEDKILKRYRGWLEFLKQSYGAELPTENREMAAVPEREITYKDFADMVYKEEPRRQFAAWLMAKLANAKLLDQKEEEKMAGWAALLTAQLPSPSQATPKVDILSMVFPALLISPIANRVLERANANVINHSALAGMGEGFALPIFVVAAIISAAFIVFYVLKKIQEFKREQVLSKLTDEDRRTFAHLETQLLADDSLLTYLQRGGRLTDGFDRRYVRNALLGAVRRSSAGRIRNFLNLNWTRELPKSDLEIFHVDALMPDAANADHRDDLVAQLVRSVNAFEPAKHDPATLEVRNEMDTMFVKNAVRAALVGRISIENRKKLDAFLERIKVNVYADSDPEEAIRQARALAGYSPEMEPRTTLFLTSTDGWNMSASLLADSREHNWEMFQLLSNFQYVPLMGLLKSMIGSYDLSAEAA